MSFFTKLQNATFVLMIKEILQYLSNPADYNKGLELLNQYVKVQKGLMSVLERRANNWNINKLKYLLIKHLNIPELTETNCISKSKEILKRIPPATHNQDAKAQIPPKTKTQELYNILPERMSDKKYAKWFYSQPKKLQELLKQQSKLTRQRAVLHKECRRINGNDIERISLRKDKLQQMQKLTEQIKKTHLIINNFRKNGKLIIPAEKKTPEHIFDITVLSEHQRVKELVNTKQQLRRMRISYEKHKGKNPSTDIKREKQIAYKVSKIKILQTWYDNYKLEL